MKKQSVSINKIIDVLKEGHKSTTEIAGRITRNHWDTIRLLDDLKDNKIVKHLKDGYWELR